MPYNKLRPVEIPSLALNKLRTESILHKPTYRHLEKDSNAIIEIVDQQSMLPISKKSKKSIVVNTELYREKPK